MTVFRIVNRPALAALIALSPLVGAASGVVFAQSSSAEVIASPWVRAQSSEIRLLLPAAIGEKKEGIVAGIEMRLPAGAKTYWRTAGETGVAPTFSFAASTGIADAKVSFPVPLAFDDGVGGTAYGYFDRVVLPVTFRLSGSGEARLAVQVDYGVCLKNMCVPANAQLSGSVPATGEATNGDDLRASLAHVPKTLSKTEAAAAGIGPVTTHTASGTVTLEVPTNVPADVDATLFIEADEPFTHPRRVAGKTGGTVFVAERPVVPGKPMGDVRLTLAWPKKAPVETTLSLDDAPKR